MRNSMFLIAYFCKNNPFIDIEFLLCADAGNVWKAPQKTSECGGKTSDTAFQSTEANNYHVKVIKMNRIEFSVSNFGIYEKGMKYGKGL